MRSKMEYRSRYEEFLEKSRSAVPAMNPDLPHIAVGYTSDLDAVLTWDQRVFDRLIAEHLQGEPAFCEGQKINTLADLASVLAYSILNGLGGELEISSPDICNWLVNNFAVTYALGGTGAQCSAALGTLGYPAVIHISDRCRPVCSDLDYPSVKTVKDGRLAPVMALATDAMPVYHFICQYDKDTPVTICGKTATAPVSNRLILDFDTIHKHFLPDPDYNEYLEAHAEQIRVLSISGFNAIVDQEIASRELRPLVAHIRRLKQRNPDLIVYLESAHYFSGKVREIIFEMLGPCIDFFGMNEEEVVAHTALEGIATEKTILTAWSAACSRSSGCIRCRVSSCTPRITRRTAAHRSRRILSWASRPAICSAAPAPASAITGPLTSASRACAAAFPRPAAALPPGRPTGRRPIRAPSWCWCPAVIWNIPSTRSASATPLSPAC